jgi:hypothetical protein
MVIDVPERGNPETIVMVGFDFLRKKRFIMILCDISFQPIEYKSEGYLKSISSGYVLNNLFVLVETINIGND